MSRAAGTSSERGGRSVRSRSTRPGLALLGCAALAAALGACVGPNFHRPDRPAVQRFTPEPLPAETTSVEGPGGAAQRFLTQQDVPRNWWTLFGSQALDDLVNEALKANPEVRVAQGALRQALENTAAQRGSYFPLAQAEFDAQRTRDATGVLQPTLNSGTALYNLFTPQVTISYVPDIFGLNRRMVESLAAAAEAARFQLDATYLTLTANVVTAAIQEAQLRAQIAVTEHVIALGRESLTVLHRQLNLGAVAEADVYAEEAVLAQLESALPPLHKQLHQTRDQLAVLTGQLPANFMAPRFELDQLTLPADLPLGVPSQLVERRPDVRAAEAELHAATAQVGVAIANMLPQITITGDIGSTAPLFAQLFKPGTGFWTIGANASQTLFQGGTLIHRKRAVDAALDQAGAQYRLAVLTAFQNVADALHALDADANALGAASRAELASQKSLGVARRQLELGSVSYLALVGAEQAYQQAMVSRVQAQASRYADTAALFQALGGSIVPLGKASR